MAGSVSPIGEKVEKIGEKVEKVGEKVDKVGKKGETRVWSIKHIIELTIPENTKLKLLVKTTVSTFEPSNILASTTGGLNCACCVNCQLFLPHSIVSLSLSGKPLAPESSV